MFRIGQGYDSHRFTEGDVVPIGGVLIPFSRGVLAHSDGDVLLHALADALLGALSLGDIGTHFSDQDPHYSNVKSTVFLHEIMQMVDAQNYRLQNMDATVIAEAPKLNPYLKDIKASLAGVLKVPVSVVSVKATTNEGMGWVGRQEGLAAQVVVLLEKN